MRRRRESTVGCGSARLSSGSTGGSDILRRTFWPNSGRSGIGSARRRPRAPIAHRANPASARPKSQARERSCPRAAGRVTRRPGAAGRVCVAIEAGALRTGRCFAVGAFDCRGAGTRARTVRRAWRATGVRVGCTGRGASVARERVVTASGVTGRVRGSRTWVDGLAAIRGAGASVEPAGARVGDWACCAAAPTGSAGPGSGPGAGSAARLWRGGRRDSGSRYPCGSAVSRTPR
jgi:hypothetical protein